MIGRALRWNREMVNREGGDGSGKTCLETLPSLQGGRLWPLHRGSSLLRYEVIGELAFRPILGSLT